MAARAGNQWDQLLYQLVRREYDLGRAIPPNLLEAQGKSAVGQLLQSVIRDGWSSKVSAQMFEAVAVVGAHAHVGVHVETGHICTSLAYDGRLGMFAGTS